MTKKLGFETLQIHAGQVIDSVTKSTSVPIYQTAAYEFDSQQHAADLFSLKQEGNIYTRLGNPTTDVLEKRIAALEGGVGAVATSSGMSAITYAVLNIAKPGDEIVTVSTLYGGTYTLFVNTFKRLNIGVTFVDPINYEELQNAINPRTKALFIETIGNPGINIIDIEKYAEIAHRNGIPLIVDNTFASPYLCKPFEHCADIVIHSTTKYIGGHGNTIGGVVVDSGKFPWDNGNFPEFVEPDPSYHGLSFWETFGEASYIAKLRTNLLRDIGASISPFNSYLLLIGLETLSLRMERHVQNAIAVAKFLKDHPKVEWVNYPGLEDNSDYELAQKYLPKGPGAIFTFGLKGGYEAGKKIIDDLEIFTHVANVGDAKSLIIHPASTTHQQLTKEQQKSAGVFPELVRVSIGLENIEDIISDLETALQKIE